MTVLHHKRKKALGVESSPWATAKLPKSGSTMVARPKRAVAITEENTPSPHAEEKETGAMMAIRQQKKVRFIQKKHEDHR